MLKSCVYIFFMKLLLCHYWITPHFFTRSDFKMIFPRISAFKMPDLATQSSPLYSLYCGTVVMHS